MGEVAAENICGHEAHYCEKTNPTCVYMEPEAASVGLTEEQCKAQDIAYKVGKFPMSANGKALILNGGEGLVKIIAGAEYGEILGMHIIGPRATDLIAEGALAIEGEMTLDEIIDTIHSHPTVTETMREAALNAEKRTIHTKNWFCYTFYPSGRHTPGGIFGTQKGTPGSAGGSLTSYFFESFIPRCSALHPTSSCGSRADPHRCRGCTGDAPPAYPASSGRGMRRDYSAAADGAPCR